MSSSSTQVKKTIAAKKKKNTEYRSVYLDI
jgi:hypothetical protein